MQQHNSMLKPTLNLNPSAQKLAPRADRRMVNSSNMSDAIWAARETAAPATGFGCTLPSRPHNSIKCDWRTTTQIFYDEKPAQARARGEAVPSAHLPCSSGKLQRDSYTTGKNESASSGRGGQRGELTRHPGEAGNVYGMSTFVDDYAQWGSKLRGVRLSHTERLKTTRYFDA